MDTPAAQGFRRYSPEQDFHTDAVGSGRAVIRQEATALFDLADGLNEDFDRAVRVLINTQRRVIVTGMGKSGHIARKIAATLAATGTPSFFVHPAEASHGDLGMVIRGDCLIALSNSGSTSELYSIVAHARALDVPIISIVSRAGSPLAQKSDITLCLPQSEEACPVRIAPTTSTTMMLALGDALAISVMRIRGITRQDLALLHPGGTIGRRFTPVDEVLRSTDPLPLVRPDCRMRDAILEMTSIGKGVAGVIDDDGHLIGIITDGDLRRGFDRIMIATAKDIMTTHPVTISSGTIVEDAYRLLTDAKIMVAFVMDADDTAKPKGLVHLHDLAINL
tara:strand:- start:92456 stop:93463 length:1008 start_codon:yes stop_codon:yes gene_type:complete